MKRRRLKSMILQKKDEAEGKGFKKFENVNQKLSTKEIYSTGKNRFG